MTGTNNTNLRNADCRVPLNRLSCRRKAHKQKAMEDEMRTSLGSFWVKCLVGALSVGAWASVANAQNTRDMVAPDKKAEAEAREAAAESIVAREEAATGRAFDPGFRAEVLTKLASRTLSELESLQSQSGAGLGILPEAFGSSQADLVYTPVTPCRIIDTRLAGGPIGPGAQRNFLAASSNYSGQGGFAGSCGVPFGPATAVAVNLVSVNPPGFGDLRAFPFGAAVPLASVLNYIAGNTVANGITLTICNPAASTCGFDFTVQSDGTLTDLVADVQGYYSLLPGTLASGKTLTGTYGVAISGGLGNFLISPITFHLPLASAPSANFIPQGGASTTNCPGTAATPLALPGQVCVYEGTHSNTTFDCLIVLSAGNCGTEALGTGVLFTLSAAGAGFSVGTWAVTAP